MLRCARQGEDRESRIENDALLPQGVFFSHVFSIVNAAADMRS
jgi:hypothetical protein